MYVAPAAFSYLWGCSPPVLCPVPARPRPPGCSGGCPRAPRTCIFNQTPLLLFIGKKYILFSGYIDISRKQDYFKQHLMYSVFSLGDKIKIFLYVLFCVENTGRGERV